jgi:hypothetical protein
MSATVGHIFAWFGAHCRSPRRGRTPLAIGVGYSGLRAMSSGLYLLVSIDRLCAQFAAALQHSQLQIYATISLVIVLSLLLFPPKGGADQF